MDDPIRRVAATSDPSLRFRILRALHLADEPLSATVIRDAATHDTADVQPTIDELLNDDLLVTIQPDDTDPLYTVPDDHDNVIIDGLETFYNVLNAPE